MTTNSTSLVANQNDVVQQVVDLLAQHPFGQSFRLIFAPYEVPVATDEVLVQVENKERGVIELRPVRVNDLDIDTVVHASQVIDPSDDEFNRYANSPVAATCLMRTNLHGQKVHIYD